MAKTKQKYYVVWQGRQTGVFTDWDACELQVKGFEGARYKSFPTREEAETAFAAGPLPVRHRTTPHAAPDTDNTLPNLLSDTIDIRKIHDRYTIDKRNNKHTSGSPEAPVVPALCVDAACSGNPGQMEYRGVYLLDIHQDGSRETTQLFHQGPFNEGTNNIGEFLALVHGLALLQKQGNTTLPVYSDSRTALAWLRQKQTKTKLTLTPRNATLFNLLRRAETWLQTHSYTNPVLKWDTDQWGEIPADFGRK